MLTPEKRNIFFTLLNKSLVLPPLPKKIPTWTEITKIALDFLEDNNEPYLREALNYLYTNKKRPKIFYENYAFCFYTDTYQTSKRNHFCYLPYEMFSGITLYLGSPAQYNHHLDAIWSVILRYHKKKQPELLPSEFLAKQHAN